MCRTAADRRRSANAAALPAANMSVALRTMSATRIHEDAESSERK
jgi:hypothetical protein